MLPKNRHFHDKWANWKEKLKARNSNELKVHNYRFGITLHRQIIAESAINLCQNINIIISDRTDRVKVENER